MASVPTLPPGVTALAHIPASSPGQVLVFSCSPTKYSGRPPGTLGMCFGGHCPCFVPRSDRRDELEFSFGVCMGGSSVLCPLGCSSVSPVDEGSCLQERGEGSGHSSAQAAFPSPEGGCRTGSQDPPGSSPWVPGRGKTH